MNVFAITLNTWIRTTQKNVKRYYDTHTIRNIACLPDLAYDRLKNIQ